MKKIVRLLVLGVLMIGILCGCTKGTASAQRWNGTWEYQNQSQRESEEASIELSIEEDGLHFFFTTKEVSSGDMDVVIGNGSVEAVLSPEEYELTADDIVFSALDAIGGMESYCELKYVSETSIQFRIGISMDDLNEQEFKEFTLAE